MKENELSIDFASIKEKFTGLSNVFTRGKVGPILLTTLLILIPVILTFYIRLLPEQLPQTETWAAGTVENYYKGQIAATINAQYPNLPQANKDQLINEQYAAFRQTNAASIEQQVRETSDFFKTGFRYQENGHTYTLLGDLDSYFYLRQARNIEAKGMICDEVKDGICWDSHILAPLGGEVTASMHPYGTVYLHKFLSVFTDKVNLMRAAFLLPTVLAAIACVAAFFIGRRLMNEVAGFFAAMFVALNPMMITRTLGSDTDIWNIILPLIIFWVFLEAVEAKNFTLKVILSVLTGFLMGFFAFAWGGWWYIMLMLIFAILGYVGVNMARNFYHHKNYKAILTQDLKSQLFMLGIIIVASAVFVTWFTDWQHFIGAFIAPFSVVSALKSAAYANLWPNVFTTVAELNEANIPTIVMQTAYNIPAFFALALLGIVLTLVKRDPDFKEYVLIICSALLYLYLVTRGINLTPYTFMALIIIPIVAAIILYIVDRHSKVDLKPALLMLIWFIAMIYSSIRGVRFISLLTPAFGIALGVTIGYLFQYALRIFKNDLKINKAISGIVVFALLCMLLLSPIKIGMAAGASFTPTMTSGWWESLTKIKEQSQPDAIINSWWDFGHWFKYVADRKVTLDGVTQNHPNAHWLGLILQTNSEREALGVLRMLDCGSNNAFEEIDKKYRDTEKSENIIRELVHMSKEEGEAHLSSQGFTKEEISAISPLMYCNPPENYFITSEDMVGKAGVWAHFGLWNFDRAFMVNEVLQKGLSQDEGTKVIMDRFNYTREQAVTLYYELQGLQTDREQNDWIAPWPGFLTQDWIGGCRLGSEVVNTTNSTRSPRQLVCPINAVIAQDANGRNVLEGAIYDFDNPQNSTLVITGYSNTGMRAGSARASPSAYVIADENNMTRLPSQNVTFPYDVIIDTVNNMTMIVASELSQSTFTKLFYFDGRYTTGFEKFSDVTDITGLRIIIWKVNWTAAE